MKGIAVIGARGRPKNVDKLLAKIRKISEREGVVIQVFDARMVFGRVHLLSAGKQALNAWSHGRSKCKELGGEILRYAAGERQVKDAIDIMGVKKETTKFAFLIVNEIKCNLIAELKLVRDDKVLEPNKRMLKRFLGRKGELNLVLEKVALTSLR